MMNLEHTQSETTPPSWMTNEEAQEVVAQWTADHPSSLQDFTDPKLHAIADALGIPPEEVAALLRSVREQHAAQDRIRHADLRRRELEAEAAVLEAQRTLDEMRSRLAASRTPPQKKLISEEYEPIVTDFYNEHPPINDRMGMFVGIAIVIAILVITCMMMFANP